MGMEEDVDYLTQSLNLNLCSKMLQKSNETV